MLGFLIGAVAGAVAATYWRVDLKKLREDRMPDLRRRAADKVEDAERAIVGTVSKLSTRASSTLRSGRPAPRGQDDVSTHGGGTLG